MVCMSSGELFLSGEPLSLSCRSLTFSDKIKAYTGDMPFFIFCIIPHITSAFCNLTGFCNGFRRTWFSFQIQVDPLILVFQKFIFQTFTGFFLSFTWYILLRALTSFPDYFRKHQLVLKRHFRQIISSYGEICTLPQQERCRIKGQWSLMNIIILI